MSIGICQDLGVCNPCRGFLPLLEFDEAFINHHREVNSARPAEVLCCTSQVVPCSRDSDLSRGAQTLLTRATEKDVCVCIAVRHSQRSAAGCIIAGELHIAMCNKRLVLAIVARLFALLSATLVGGTLLGVTWSC